MGWGERLAIVVLPYICLSTSGGRPYRRRHLSHPPLSIMVGNTVAVPSNLAA